MTPEEARLWLSGTYSTTNWIMDASNDRAIGLAMVEMADAGKCIQAFCVLLAKQQGLLPQDQEKS